MYPLYGKTLKSVKNMVKTLLHNPKVLMKWLCNAESSVSTRDDRRRCCCCCRRSCCCEDPIVLFVCFADYRRYGRKDWQKDKE
jgi:hypothetical protein